MIDLKEKIILVTGASSGFGRGIAILASSLGASVIITGRNEKELNTTLSQMHSQSQEHCVIPFDLKCHENFDALFSKIANFSKKIDGVAHCAGVSVTEPLRFTNIDSVNNVIDLNIKSTLHLIAGLRKKRTLNKNSSIVLLSSLSAFLPEKGISAYAASKGATASLCKSLAAELVSPDRVRVNCLAPGIVKTEMIIKDFESLSDEAITLLQKKYPLGFGEVNDIANAAAYFLSDASKWVTGSCLLIDGGRSLGID